jgi:non-ribosomal peptide synthetase component E (peptide arylation enzyme)
MIHEYLESGSWSSGTTVSAIDGFAQDFPFEEAVVDTQVRLTWEQVKRSTDLLALGFLDIGLKRDDVVVVQLPNGVETILVRIALNKAGILAAFVPIVWRRTEMEQILKRLNATAIIIVDEFRGFDYLDMIACLQAQSLTSSMPHLLVVGETIPSGATSVRELMNKKHTQQAFATRLNGLQHSPGDVSILSISSGSTGEPKICEWPEGAQVLTGKGIASGLKLTREDVVGIFAPIGGGAGAMAWLAASQMGCKIVLSSSMTAEVILELIEREHVSFVATVPAILIRLLDCSRLSRYDLRSLRVVRTGTAAISPSVARDAECRLACIVAPGYGSMETISIAQAGVDDPSRLRLGGSVGRALPGRDVKVVDENGQEVPKGQIGELWVRGPGTSSGYFQDPEGTARAWGELGRGGWFRTGDLAHLDNDENIILEGRKKEVIIRGGNKIYPIEIESLLFSHAKILEVAVIGTSHPALGEIALAFVIPRTGEDLTSEEILAFLVGKDIASYKLPEQVIVVDEFPRLDSNKVDKQRLVRQLFA